MAYEHIEQMEERMTQQEDLVRQAEKILGDIESKLNEYRVLKEYYYSEQRCHDLDDDEKRLIPDDIKRGVLSEDGLYNLFLDERDMAIHMIEVALKILKIS